MVTGGGCSAATPIARSRAPAPASGRLTVDRLYRRSHRPARRSRRARKALHRRRSSHEAADAARAHVWRRRRAHVVRRGADVRRRNRRTRRRRAGAHLALLEPGPRVAPACPRGQCVRGRSRLDLQQHHRRCLAPLRIRRRVDARRGARHPLAISAARNLHELGPGHRMATALPDRRQPIRRSSEARAAGVWRSRSAHRRHLSLDRRSVVGSADDRTGRSRARAATRRSSRSIQNCGGR